ncbi:MAG: DMT family protein [Bdellovibrionota bacterium]
MQVIVPLMLFCSSILMALAWLGHIRFRDKGFMVALLASWFLVLPEYVLNIIAFRWGHGIFSPSEMAAINLSSGVICIALVSRYFLFEKMAKSQWIGFGLMAISVALIVY